MEADLLMATAGFRRMFVRSSFLQRLKSLKTNTPGPRFSTTASMWWADVCKQQIDIEQRHNMKKPTLISLSAVLSTAIVMGIQVQTIADPEYDYLLPREDGATPEGQGYCLLQDPFSTDGIMIGTWNESRNGAGWTHTVTRLTPSDPNWITFNEEGLDNGLTVAKELAYNPGDRIYASGLVYVKTGSRPTSPSVSQWRVRSSVSGATGTWADEDSFYYSVPQGKGKNATVTPQYSVANGLTTDSDGVNPGNVYVCGPASDGATYRWVVRKKSVEASHGWQEVLALKSNDSASVPHEIRHFPGKTTASETCPQAMFVVGVFNGTWAVLRITDNGWDFVDMGWEGADAACAYDVVCNSQGDIYVAGVRRESGYDRGWVLRRSQDGGDNWEQLLYEPHVVNSWLVNVRVDLDGNVTLTGSISDPDGSTWGSPRWTVVRNSPNQTWADSWANRTFPFPGISSSGADSLPTPSGPVFMTGRVYDAEAGRHNVALLRMFP
jgi:hypothetical protein